MAIKIRQVINSKGLAQSKLGELGVLNLGVGAAAPQSTEASHDGLGADIRKGMFADTTMALSLIVSVFTYSFP